LVRRPRQPQHAVASRRGLDNYGLVRSCISRRGPELLDFGAQPLVLAQQTVIAWLVAPDDPPRSGDRIQLGMRPAHCGAERHIHLDDAWSPLATPHEKRQSPGPSAAAPAPQPATPPPRRRAA